jgi:hypothetical protein
MYRSHPPSHGSECLPPLKPAYITERVPCPTQFNTENRGNILLPPTRLRDDTLCSVSFIALVVLCACMYICV